MLVEFIIRRILIPVGLCAVAAWYIFDQAGDYRKTPAEKFIETGGDTLKKQTVHRFGTQFLQNPGKYYELPEETQRQIDAQMKAFVEAGQEVLCCDYDSDQRPGQCSGRIMWKDKMAVPLTAIVDVHSYSELAYLGNRGHAQCPATRKGAWDAIGLIAGYGWSPRNFGKDGHPDHLRELIVEGPDD